MLLTDTIDIQTKLANYTRTGNLPDIPGIHIGHVKQYRRLVFNIIKNNLFRAFPIATKVIGNERFTEMVDVFFRLYDVKTSQIWLLPGEFYDYALHNNWNEKYSLPWLSDLLLFEWIEIKVHTLPDKPKQDTHPSGDVLTSQLVINPDYDIIHLSFPVHKYPIEEAETKEGDYYLLIFRNPDSGKVHFINLSVLHVTLIERLVNKQDSLSNILPELAAKFDIKDFFQLQTAIVSFVRELIDQHFVLGFHRASLQ